MTAWLLMQYIIIAVAVLASLVVVVKKQFPHATRRMRIALAVPLLRESSPGWVQTIGRMVAPAGSSNADACGTCNGCDTGSGKS